MGVQTEELSFSFSKIPWMLLYSRAAMTTLWHVCQNQHLQNSPQASSSTFCRCCCCSPVSRLRREDESGDDRNTWNGLKVVYGPFPESCNTGTLDGTTAVVFGLTGGFFSPIYYNTVSTLLLPL